MPEGEGRMSDLLFDDELVETIDNCHLGGCHHRTVIACHERPWIGMKRVDFDCGFLSSMSARYLGITQTSYTIDSAES